MQPLLLCICMEQNQLMRISFLASALGIRVKAVREAEWGQTLGMICGLDTPSSGTTAGKAGGPMLVMAFFQDSLMDKLLRELRANGQSVRLKAVLTPYNRHWTCQELYRQLSMEAAQLER